MTSGDSVTAHRATASHLHFCTAYLQYQRSFRGSHTSFTAFALPDSCWPLPDVGDLDRAGRSTLAAARSGCEYMARCTADAHLVGMDMCCWYLQDNVVTSYQPPFTWTGSSILQVALLDQHVPCRHCQQLTFIWMRGVSICMYILATALCCDTDMMGTPTVHQYKRYFGTLLLHFTRNRLDPFRPLGVTLRPSSAELQWPVNIPSAATPNFSNTVSRIHV